MEKPSDKCFFLLDDLSVFTLSNQNKYFSWFAQFIIYPAVFLLNYIFVAKVNLDISD